MRQLTTYEKAQIAAAYANEPTPTQAVTIEWEFFMRQNKTISGITSTYQDDFFWEEMVFPAEIQNIGGVDTLVVNRKYVDNNFTFSTTDGPKDRATGQSFNFQTLADDTAYANPEADEIPNNTARATIMNRTTVNEPGKIWARRIKKYTFDATTGEITDIHYYVFKNVLNVGATWPNGVTTGAQSQGTVQRTTDGDNYRYPLYDETVNGPITMYVSGAHTSTITVPAASVLPLGNTGETNELLHNAKEAQFYQNRVTTDVPVDAPDPYANRQAAREALATAIWG